MKTFKYIFEETQENEMILSPKNRKLLNMFVKDMEKVDDSLSYKDLAEIIASMLQDNYGSHNYKPFIKELTKNLR